MRISLLNPFKRYAQKVGDPPGTLVYTGEKRTERIRITVTDYNEEYVHENEVQTIKECLPFKETQTVTWIQVEGIHDTEVIKEIGEHFDINPLILEDLMSPIHLPKIEIHEDYGFILLKSLKYHTSDSGGYREQISLIIGANYVISLQENLGDVFTSVQKRLHNAQGRIRKMGADYLAYALMDVIVDNYFILLEALSEQIELVEEETITNPTPEVLRKINALRRELLLLRRPILPLRDVISEILHESAALFREETHLYFRDIYDHLIQVIQTLETLRTTTAGLFDTYTSVVSHKMNEVMKMLTIVATIFIPLTFIAGIYGMNFKFMPELETRWGYPVVLLVMVGVGITMFIYFKFKKWL